MVTVGTFDGVHRGHQQVLARLAARARQTGWHSLLVTFEPHPLEVVNPTAARPLLSVGMEKFEVLAESGIDYCIVLPFTPTLARYRPDEFIDHVLRSRFRMREMLSGYDNGFGRAGRAMWRRSGPSAPAAAFVSRWCRRRPWTTAGRSRRRRSAGQSRGAICGRPARSSAAPIPSAAGSRRARAAGRTLGYPTLNIPLPPPRKLLPPEGVYAVRVQTPAGPRGGMLNLGPRPTFGDSRVGLEVHVFDTAGDLYDAYVRIEFIARLRDVRTFASADALRAQLARDEEQARRLLSGFRAGRA